MKKISYKGEINLSGYILPCYVDEDGVRLLSSREMQRTLKVVDENSGPQVSGSRFDRFLNYKILSGFREKYHEEGVKPIKRMLGKSLINGYKAEMLVEICNYMLNLRREGLFEKGLKNYHRSAIIADQCEILIQAFAKTGLIALIDEATGYQSIRVRNALQKILEKYISKELMKWQKRFPDEFYAELFRLNNWQLNPVKVKRPGVVGKMTNNMIYERLAPRLLSELRKVNPKNLKGGRSNKHHQWLTEDIGHPKLRDHISGVIALMKASSNYSVFKRLLERAYPKLNETKLLPFDNVD